MPAYSLTDLAFDKVSRSGTTVLKCLTESGEVLTLTIDYHLLVPLASEVTCMILSELGEVDERGDHLPAVLATPSKE